MGAGKSSPDTQQRLPTPPNAEHPARVRRLQAELMLSEQRLEEALAEVISSNAELHVANAEQYNLNEELRNANEELAASESTLQLLNAELARQIEALADANADMRGVIESTQIAIVFLDEELLIRSFTPAVQAVLHVHEADRGRPVTDLAMQIGYPELADDARRVLRDHGVVERQASHPWSGSHYLIRLLPYRGISERVIGVVITFLDISATFQAEHALRASDERFRRMAAAVPALLFIASPGTGWEYVNPPFYSLTGLPAESALGKGWCAALHPDDREPCRALWQQAYDTAGIMEHEARLRRADDSWCWFLIRAVPQLDPAGGIIRWYGSCTDIDERRRAETRQGLLLADLQHRIKNILAVVRSVMTRTLESSYDLEHFAEHLAGRIGALSRTQGIAARTAEGFVMLEDIVYQELQAHGGQDERQFHVEGPPVWLPAKTADALGLAIHELTTNSIKYGALAIPNGRIKVCWRTEPVADDTSHSLDLEWQESGVPLTDLQPKRRGFGRELIEQGLPYELGAVTDMKFRPGGLRCEILLRVSAMAPGESHGARWMEG